METLNILIGVALALVLLYLYRVNSVLAQTPPEVAAHFGEELTRERVIAAYKRVKDKRLDWTSRLPPRQTRRYVIVGGSGKLSWESQHAFTKPN